MASGMWLAEVWLCRRVQSLNEELPVSSTSIQDLPPLPEGTPPPPDWDDQDSDHNDLTGGIPPLPCDELAISPRLTYHRDEQNMRGEQPLPAEAYELGLAAQEGNSAAELLALSLEVPDVSGYKIAAQAVDLPPWQTSSIFAQSQGTCQVAQP